MPPLKLIAATDRRRRLPTLIAAAVRWLLCLRLDSVAVGEFRAGAWARAWARDNPDLPPAEVEKLLAGFRVEHSFVLRHGVREYVAVRER